MRRRHASTETTHQTEVLAVMADFNVVSSRVNFPELDAQILEYWRERDVFRRWAEDRADAPLFAVNEKPLRANCSPGVHLVLVRVFRDVISRYRTMKGYRVLRKGSWDTHGLSVEMATRHKLGLSSKLDMEEYGIAELNRSCREFFLGVHDGLRGDCRPHRLLGRHGSLLRYPGNRPYRDGLVGIEATLGPGPAVPGSASRTPLSPLRVRHIIPCGGAELPGA